MEINHLKRLKEFDGDNHKHKTINADATLDI
jgi:hypothetical protein